jgi:flagellar biosynthetic protein FlhB
MAESDGQERTEQATPKRREEARRKGQVPRSRELNTTLVLLAASGMMLAFGGHFISVLAEIFHDGLSVQRAQLTQPEAMLEALASVTRDGLLALLPFLAVMVLVALVAPLLLSGWTFSAESIGLKWERLDPIKGLGRIFAWRGALELVKALLKFALILGVAVALLWSDVHDLMALGGESPAVAAAHAARLVAWAFLILSGALVLLPLIDVPFQLWDYTRQLRMTRQEIKDEMKQSDGSPEVKARLRQLQRDLARRRMMEAVPKADVIVTNPTHYAVALQYEQTKNRAPVVVAKGMDLIALQIRNVGEQHRVPIVEAPPLARALYHSTRLDQEIPAGLYLAVAKLLAYVYQLKHLRPEQNRASVPQPEFPVPDEFVGS